MESRTPNVIIYAGDLGCGDIRQKCTLARDMPEKVAEMNQCLRETVGPG